MVVHLVVIPLALGVLAGYAYALWRWLRGESVATLLLLGGIVVAAAALRLVALGDYPDAIAEDEYKQLADALRVLHGGNPLEVFRNGEILFPILPSVLFKATLVPWLGPDLWAIRGYSLLCSLLAISAVFALGRGCGFRTAPSLALAAFVAALPWGIYFGRVDASSVVLHQILLLAALARLVFGRGGHAEVAIGGFALALLLYDYHAGRVMLVAPFVAAALAPRGRRLGCLVVVPIALVAWMPHIMASGDPTAIYRGYPRLDSQVSIVEQPRILYDSLVKHARVFVMPENWTAPVMSSRSGSWHPGWFLVLAVFGSLRGFRLGLFLWIGFLAGLAPSIISGGFAPSSRRLLMAYPFVSLAAAAAIDRVGSARVRRAVAAAAVLVVAVQGSQMYFSEETWPPQDRGQREAQISALVRSLSFDSDRPIVVDPTLHTYTQALAAAGAPLVPFTPDAWMPPATGAIFAFGTYSQPLESFLRGVYGPTAVTGFGGAFRLDVPAGNWSRLTQHGWQYERRCGEDVATVWVAVLFHELLDFERRCEVEPVERRWLARWEGPPQELVLRDRGEPVVHINGGGPLPLAHHEGIRTVEFEVERGDRIEVRSHSASREERPLIALYLAGEERLTLPAWQWLVPLPLAGE